MNGGYQIKLAVSYVTDNASNIIAAARLTGWKNLPCMAHTLNLIVQESIKRIEDLVILRRKCR